MNTIGRIIRRLGLSSLISRLSDGGGYKNIKLGTKLSNLKPITGLRNFSSSDNNAKPETDLMQADVKVDELLSRSYWKIKLGYHPQNMRVTVENLTPDDESTPPKTPPETPKGD